MPGNIAMKTTRAYYWLNMTARSPEQPSQGKVVNETVNLNCPRCGHEMDLPPPDRSLPTMDTGGDGDVSMTADERRRSRSAIGRLVIAFRTGRITENPSDEALDILMSRGFDGIEKVRSAEFIAPSVSASDRKGRLRPASRA